MDKKEDQISNEARFLVCPACRGTGRLNRVKCSQCQGIGVGLVNPEWFAYWSRRVDRAQIFQDKIKDLVRYAINSALILLGAVGLLLIIWQVFYLNANQVTSWLFWRSVWQSQSNWSLVFWLSLLGDFYLIYRLVQESKIKQKVPKKSYGQNLPPIINTWPEVRLLSPMVKKEISLSFTPAALKAVQQAWRLAKNWRHAEVTAIHLLGALFIFPRIRVMLSRLGINFSQLKEKIKQALNRQPPQPSQPPILSTEFKKILLHAYWRTYEELPERVDLDELMEGLVQFTNQVTEIFYDLNIDQTKVQNVAQWLRVQKVLRANWQRFRRRARWKPKGTMDRAMTAVATPFLDAFSQDLTALAKFGYLTPCLDREKEFAEIFRLIEGRQRSLVLIGQPGVGKNSILEGLAQRMAAEEVPKILRDKRLVSLSIARLIGGATPAQAGDRLLNVIHEILYSGNIILVIPNIQDMLGITTGQEESLDLSEILVAALERHSLICLATATPLDYRRYIEGTALGNILEKLSITEMSDNQAIQVLESKTGSLEYKNKTYFSYEAIAQAVKLATRYLREHFLPEKAIGILEEAAIYVRQQRGVNQIINSEDVAKIIAEKTNIPVTKITEEESKKLLNLEARIHQRLVDQKPAVKMVAAALRRARAELRDLRRPIVNLLFLGPTGVGKTELTKTVAEVYFGSEENMIRLDMSEYQAVSSIARLIGSPNQRASGYLTEAVRKKPFALLLLDEIEKAHPDILNIFLQVMDDGRLTDAQGQTVDFTNIILIATSNAGTQFIQDKIRAGLTIDQIRQQLLAGELKKYFRPEFLNRFDGVIVFKPLTISEVQQITQLMLKQTTQQLANKGIEFQVTEEAIIELAQTGFDPVYGARPLRRVIQEQVSNVLANYLLQNKIGRRDRVILEAGGRLRVEKAEQI